MTRIELETELERLMHSPSSRAFYLRLDDDRLAAAISRMQETEKLVARIGHVAAANRQAKTVPAR